MVMGSDWSSDSKEIILRKTVVLNRSIRLAPFKICTENMDTIVEREEPMRITITKTPKWYKKYYK